VSRQRTWDRAILAFEPVPGRDPGRAHRTPLPERPYGERFPSRLADGQWRTGQSFLADLLCPDYQIIAT